MSPREFDDLHDTPPDGYRRRVFRAETNASVKKTGPLIAVGVVVAGLGALIGIGAFPKINDLCTKAEAARSLGTMATELKDRHDKDQSRNDEKFEAVIQTIRDSNVVAREELRKQGEAIEKIDARLWTVLQEVKKR